jgi:hypothetical protein
MNENSNSNNNRHDHVTDDLVGQVFGYLKVIERVTRPVHVRSGVYYRCECLRCGKMTTVLSYSLKRGDTRSCGCLQKTYRACVKAGIPYDKTMHMGPPEVN